MELKESTLADPMEVEGGEGGLDGLVDNYESESSSSPVLQIQALDQGSKGAQQAQQQPSGERRPLNALEGLVRGWGRYSLE